MIFSADEDTRESEIARRLGARGARVALVEVGTNGMAAERLASAIPDSFAGGLVAADVAGLSAFGLGPAPAGGALERARGLADAVARRAGVAVDGRTEARGHPAPRPDPSHRGRSERMIAPSAGYSFTIRLQIRNRPGMLGRVASAMGEAGGDIGAVDIVETTREQTERDITVKARDSVHAQKIVARLKRLAGVRVVNISDRTFLMHLGGKIEIRNKVPIRTRDDLSMAYTPGVARVCLAIRDDRRRAFSLTIRQNMVAVVTDGTAVLGLGDLGPEAALPVMEGKAMLFKEFAGVDAFPICLATKDPDKIVETVKLIASACGRSLRSRSSTTTSTGRPSSCWRRCSTRSGSSARTSGRSASSSRASGRPVPRRSRSSSRAACGTSSAWTSTGPSTGVGRRAWIS